MAIQNWLRQWRICLAISLSVTGTTATERSPTLPSTISSNRDLMYLHVRGIMLEVSLHKESMPIVMASTVFSGHYGIITQATQWPTSSSTWQTLHGTVMLRWRWIALKEETLTAKTISYILTCDRWPGTWTSPTQDWRAYIKTKYPLLRHQTIRIYSFHKDIEI